MVQQPKSALLLLTDKDKLQAQPMLRLLVLLLVAMLAVILLVLIQILRLILLVLLRASMAMQQLLAKLRSMQKEG